MNLVDEVYTAHPCYGTRRIRVVLERDHGLVVGRRYVASLMRRMGIEALYPKSRLSQPTDGVAVYPYLLTNLAIVRPNQVWGTDITYVRLVNGFAYLVAFLDWFSRYVVSWELSNDLTIDFVLAARDKALALAVPEITNSDRGSHFTSQKFIEPFESRNVAISQDGRGRCMDNIFTERLWRTVKQEDIYIKGYSTIKEARNGLNDFFVDYNERRPHQSLNYQTPKDLYFGTHA